MNKERSATAERLYRKDPRLEVRSGGVRSDAKHRVSEKDLRWADVIFAMEREHKLWLTTRFEALELPPIEVLEIPDEYAYMDPKLMEILRMILDPEVDALLTGRAHCPEKSAQNATRLLVAPRSTPACG